jgi:hypothetical protein
MNGRRYGSIFLPLVLIGIGIVFLLNNLGVVSWNVWDTLFRLWPIVLVALGLDLILGRGVLRGLLAFAILAVVLVGAGALVFELGGSGQWTLTQRTISEPLRFATSGEVHVGFGTGTLEVSASSDPLMFVEGEIAVAQNENVHPGFSLASNDNVAHFSVETSGSFPRIGHWGERVWTLRLNRAVPISLEVSTGAGRAELNLVDLNLTDLDIRGGVGEAIVTLPGRGRFTAEIHGGVGKVTVWVPVGLGVRIVATGGLGSVEVPSDYSREDHVYTSRDYATAESRVDIAIRGGVGEVTVRTI